VVSRQLLEKQSHYTPVSTYWSTDSRGCTTHSRERICVRVTRRHERVLSLHHHDKPQSRHLMHCRALASVLGRHRAPMDRKRAAPIFDHYGALIGAHASPSVDMVRRMDPSDDYRSHWQYRARPGGCYRLRRGERFYRGGWEPIAHSRRLTGHVAHQCRASPYKRGIRPNTCYTQHSCPFLIGDRAQHCTTPHPQVSTIDTWRWATTDRPERSMNTNSFVENAE
jgi:hypothetical protein